MADHQTTPPLRNASTIDAYFDGMWNAGRDLPREVPNVFTPGAAKEWLRGYDDRLAAGGAS